MIKATDLPSIKTARLALDPLVAGHARLLYSDLLDPALYTYIPRDPPASRRVLANQYARLETRASPDGFERWLNWAMRIRHSHSYAGTLQVTIRGDRRALIAYQVVPRFWRRGFAKEGCAAILKWLFDDQAVSTVAAEIDSRNLASIGVVESLGFRRVALVKGADFFKGCSSDEVHYALGERLFHRLSVASSANPSGDGPRKP